MTGPDAPGVDRLAAFVDALERDRGTRVSRERLWEALAEAFPHRTPGAPERQLLVDVLRELEKEGRVRLPPEGGRRWDRSLIPAVPTGVDLVREPSPAPGGEAWRTFPWHPRLTWVAEMGRLTAGQVAFLRRVHRGLVEGWFAEPAPIAYRSLQLTGDEKGLTGLVGTSLFGDGRLTLDLLGCAPEALPLAWEPVGPGGRLLIVENAGPFAVARRVLGSMEAPPYGLVGYGGGRGILSAIAHVPSMSRTVSEIHYVGDLDVAELDIAVGAARRAASLGLPAVRPAEKLHVAMFEAAAAFGRPEGWPGRSVNGQGRLDELATAVAPDLWPRVRAMLADGRRIPEEVLGPGELRRVWGE